MDVVSSQSFAAVLEGRRCQKNKIEENKNADQDKWDNGVQDTATGQQGLKVFVGRRLQIR
jgi:hypothetical protein